MTSELVTAVEVDKSLYVYHGNNLRRYFHVPPKDMLEVVQRDAEKYQQIRISHDEWDILLDWEDRVSHTSLESVLLSAKYRGLTIDYVVSQEG